MWSNDSATSTGLRPARSAERGQKVESKVNGKWGRDVGRWVQFLASVLWDERWSRGLAPSGW